MLDYQFYTLGIIFEKQSKSIDLFKYYSIYIVFLRGFTHIYLPTSLKLANIRWGAIYSLMNTVFCLFISLLLLLRENSEIIIFIQRIASITNLISILNF